MGGCGVVVSRCSSEQKGRIRSYRYHFCSSDRPFGVMRGARSSGAGCQSSRRRDSWVSVVVSASSRANTLPGDEAEKRKWWYFLCSGISGSGAGGTKPNRVSAPSQYPLCVQVVTHCTQQRSLRRLQCHPCSRNWCAWRGAWRAQNTSQDWTWCAKQPKKE